MGRIFIGILGLYFLIIIIKNKYFSAFNFRARLLSLVSFFYCIKQPREELYSKEVKPVFLTQ